MVKSPAPDGPCAERVLALERRGGTLRRAKLGQGWLQLAAATPESGSAPAWGRPPPGYESATSLISRRAPLFGSDSHTRNC
jgi:hypothetical protein